MQCLFVTPARPSAHDGTRCIRCDVKGGATRDSHYCSRTFENAVRNAHGVYEACKATPGLHCFRLLGTVPIPQLAEILSLSDLHIYLSVPFVLAVLALSVLRDPRAWRLLSADGRALVEDRYSLEKTLPRLWDLFTQMARC